MTDMPEFKFGGPIRVLDHGYVGVVESWGSDQRIVEAARMSTQKGFLGWGPVCNECGSGEWEDDPEWDFRSRTVLHLNPDTTKVTLVAGKRCAKCRGLEAKAGDEKLLRYLHENHHDTPFEMAGMVVEVQAPIFVFREWHRHRVPWSYNEASARYAPLPDVNYVPTVERCALAGGPSKQSQGAVSKVLDRDEAERFRTNVQILYQQAEEIYQAALGAGVPKELARVVLPVGRYSRMRASANLRGWLHFIGLRSAPNAQYEIRQYANAAADFIKDLFPRTWELFAEKR